MRKAPYSMLVAAFAIAAFLVWLHPTYQDATIPALAISGQIPVQADSLMGQYFFGMWSAVNQAGGLLLWLGLPQPGLDYTYDALFVGASLAGYAMLIFGAGATVVFSLTGATLCFATGILVPVFMAKDYSAGWTVWANPDPYTYGAAAYAATTLVIGALAGGRNALAGFVCAVLIAMHPVVGTYMTAVLVATWVLSRWFMPLIDTTGIIRGFTAGLGIVAISFVAYLAMRPAPWKAFDPSAYRMYLQFWDYHRTRTFEPTALAFDAIGLVAVGAATFLPGWARLPVRLGAMATVLSMFASATLYLTFYFLRDHLPALFTSAMPNRFLSVHAALAGAMAIALAYGIWSSVAARTRINSFASQALAWAALACFVFVVQPSAFALARNLRQTFARQTSGDGLLQLSQQPFWVAVRTANIRSPVLASFTAAEPAERQGHLPLLLDVSGIDFVPYLPFTAHAVAEVIEQGYGIAFDNPPPEVRNKTVLARISGRDYWAALSNARWRALSEQLGFGAVIAPADWHIDLPPIVAGPDFVLYRVPS